MTPYTMAYTPTAMPIACKDKFGTTAIIRPIINAATDDRIIDVVVFLKRSFIFSPYLHCIIILIFHEIICDCLITG